MGPLSYHLFFIIKIVFKGGEKMKKLLLIALCLCAMLSVCVTFTKEEPSTEVETVSMLSKKCKEDVRVGAPSEGIVLL